MGFGGEALYLCPQVVLGKVSCTRRLERPLVHVFGMFFSDESSKDLLLFAPIADALFSQHLRC